MVLTGTQFGRLKDTMHITITNKVKTHYLSRTVVLAAALIAGCAKEEPVVEGIQESGYVVPFPVQQGNEKIDVVVRVRDNKRPYQFMLILVDDRSWPMERRKAVWRMFDGWAPGETQIVPYPIRLRLRIDSLGELHSKHLDMTISTRSPAHMHANHDGSESWFAQRLDRRSFPPGLYRVRLDNLSPAPEIDFPTLFQFKRDGRKY